MLSVIGGVLTCLIFFRIHVPSLFNNKQYRDLSVYLLLLLLSTTLIVLDGFGIQIPNPFKVIEMTFKPIGIMIFGA